MCRQQTEGLTLPSVLYKMQDALHLFKKRTGIIQNQYGSHKGQVLDRTKNISLTELSFFDLSGVEKTIEQLKEPLSLFANHIM